MSRTFTPGDIAVLAGINPETLRVWRHEGYVRLGEPAGNTTKYSMREVVTLFIGKEIARHDFTLSEAFHVALSDDVQEVLERIGDPNSDDMSENYLFVARDTKEDSPGVKYALHSDVEPLFDNQPINLKTLKFKPDNLHRTLSMTMLMVNEAWRTISINAHRRDRESA